MASSRTKRRRQTLLQILALAAAAAVVVVGVFSVQRWWSSRPGPAPETITVTATSGDSSVEAHPYQVTELGHDPRVAETAYVPVDAASELRVTVPEDVSENTWQAVMIYDDPAANDQKSFGPNEASDVTVPGSVDLPTAEETPRDGEKRDTAGERSEPRPRLVLVEISTILVGHDDEGEETAYEVVWSLWTGDTPPEDAESSATTDPRA